MIARPGATGIVHQLKETQKPIVRMTDVEKKDEVIVVTGLPRSGTSMIMRMLQSGGLDLMTDGVRRPDPDNPMGYFEYEGVKKLKTDASRLYRAKGKAVKIVSPLLAYLPYDLNYRMIFVRRNLAEILASQRKMIERRNPNRASVPDDGLVHQYRLHLNRVQAWLQDRGNMACLFVEYRAVLADPRLHAANIRDFLGLPLDVDGMAGAVEPSLYRNRLHDD